MEKQIKRLVALAEKCGKLGDNADGKTAKGMPIAVYDGYPWNGRYTVTFGDIDFWFFTAKTGISFQVGTTADDLKDICEDVTEFLSHLPEGDEK